MSLLNLAQRYLPGLIRGQPAPSRAESLALRPVRNRLVVATPRRSGAELPEEGEEVELALQVPLKSGVLNRVMSRVFGLPASRRIELDEFGSRIWEQCDGKHNVEQMVRFTAERYKLNRRQAEVSIFAFMRMLSQRHLIGFISSEGEAAHVTKPPARRRKRHRRR